MPSSKPSIAEIRAVCQPAAVVGRPSAEHWAGRLYMRRISAHVTRRILDAPVTPNALTVWMLVVGVIAAAVATSPTWWAAVVAAVLIQLYLLLDCVDGELARWRRMTSAAGVYLDRLGHYVVEAALLIGVGVRADGGLTAMAGWSTVGAVGAALLLVTKAESDLVALARSSAGLPPADDADPAPRQAGLATLRRRLGRLRFHRIIGAIELSLALVVVAVIDHVTGTLVATRALLVFAAIMALAVAVAHPVMILASRRLR